MKIDRGALLVLVPAVAVLAIIGTRLFDRESPPAAPRAGASSEEFKVLEQRIQAVANNLEQQIEDIANNREQGGGQQLDSAQQIADLRKQLATLKEQLKRQDSALDARGQSKGEISELMRLTSDPEVRAKVQRFAQNQRQIQQAFVNQTFEGQPVDSAWATDATQKIQGAFFTPEIAQMGQLVSADCRSTLCRATFDFSSAAAQLTGTDAATARFEFENNVLLSLSKDMPIAMSDGGKPNGQGGYRYTVTFVRKGSEMPRSPDRIKTQGVSTAEAIRFLRNLQ